MKCYAYNPNVFKTVQGADWDCWRAIYQFVPDGVQVIDRTGYIKTPVHSTCASTMTIPEYDPDFNLSYQESCFAKVRKIVRDSESYGVPIRLMYSGGIDSSMVLASFISYLGVDETARRVEIAMSHEGIQENPWMWERFIRPYFKVVDSEKFSGELKKTHIIVGGECNDQVMGTDLYKGMIAWRGAEILDTPYSEATTLGYLEFRKLRKDHAQRWYELLQSNVDRAPCSIETTAEWWWWLNFTCKWSHCYYRMAYFASNTTQFDADYFDTYYQQFFNAPEIQKWAMKDRTHKHKGDFTSYKWHAREIIADTMNAPEYLYKSKHPSLGQVARFTRSADLIAEDYSLQYNINPVDYYNPENSFVV